MIKKQYYILILVILGSVALNFLNSPVSEIFFDDKEIFKYVGLVIYKGGVPYRDVFDHKPPLIYFLNAFYWFGVWIPWILDTCLILFSTLLFYWLCRKNRLPNPWVLPLLSHLLIRYSLISFGNGMTREYTGAFLLIFFCVMQGNARNKYFILGLLVALTGWMQQDALLTLAPFLFYSIFIAERKAKNELGKRIISMVSGFAVISAPIIFYFSSHQSLTWLWRDAFLFNFNAPGYHPGLSSELKTIKHSLHEGELEMPFYTALILGLACSLMIKNKSRTLIYMALLTLVFSFSGEFLSGRLASGPGFIYYLLPLAASIPIMLYVVFTEAPISFLQDKKAQFILSIIASVTVILGTIRYATGFHLSSDKDIWFSKDAEIEYLKSTPLSDYELFVFDDSNLIYLYNYHKILCPTPWIYHYFWSWDKNFDPDNKIMESIFHDLQTHKTRFILDCSIARHNIQNKKVFDAWQEFLQSHYVCVMKYPSNRVLWRIQ